jgi:hypothetical protein
MKQLAARALVLALVTGSALVQSGCKGCSKEPESTPAPAEPATEAPAPAVAPPAAVSPAAEASPTQAPTYPGPRSESVDHFRITTGFANGKGEPQPQPNALEPNQVYVTVLDPEGRPIGQLDKLERGEMHGFLVARDLRQVLYANATGPLKEGADARALSFNPREGGDHAFLAVFQPHGGTPRVISAPVSIHGALPEVMGPGLESLSMRAKVGQDHIQLSTTPAQPIAGQPVHLSAQDFDTKGQARGEVKLPFVVIVNDQMGWGSVVEWDDHGQAVWTPPNAGTWLVLAPPTHGEQGLAFKIAVGKPGAVAVPEAASPAAK